MDLSYFVKLPLSEYEYPKTERAEADYGPPYELMDPTGTVRSGVAHFRAGDVTWMERDRWDMLTTVGVSSGASWITFRTHLAPAEVVDLLEGTDKHVRDMIDKQQEEQYKKLAKKMAHLQAEEELSIPDLGDVILKGDN